MKKKYGAALAALLTLSVLLAGCGDTKSGDKAETVNLGGDAKAESTAEAAKPSGKQELIFVLSNQPDSLDPSYTNNSFAAPFIINCFEGLVTYDAKGELVPGNAESWESNEDMTVYTFRLRDGLKWSDGSPLTAEDYVYAAKHVCTPATTAQYLNMMTDYTEGAEAYYEGKGSDESFGVKAIDDRTLEYRLKAPCPFFPDIVSMWVYSPLKKETLEANGDKWTQTAATYVCNGPFKISEINSGASVVLTKNENYWDAANVSLEKLSFRYILDTSTALTAYENGEVDGIRSIPSGDLARLKAENAGVVVTPNYGTVYYNINCGKEPYNNPKVRKALALAIDRNALINNVAQLDATPAYSWMAPGYVIDGKDITEGRSDFDLKPTADPEAAKAALAEAGYANPATFPTIHLSYYSDDNAKKVAEAMAEMLTGNLGVKVEVSSADWAVFYDAVQNGDYEVAAMGWSADYVNPMSFLPLLYTDDVANSLFYSNSNYDALVDRIRSERDSAKFAELVKQADETVSVEYPVLPLYYKSNTYLMHNYVSGVYMTSNGNLYFKKAVVSK